MTQKHYKDKMIGQNELREFHFSEGETASGTVIIKARNRKEAEEKLEELKKIPVEDDIDDPLINTDDLTDIDESLEEDYN